ncbi:MAG: PhzF family phenazine biosynthesis protein [Rhodovarius sp.]|nr:PhzF family phenazine biosynthesis protein [Rhodovarius sp.]
MRRYRFVTVDVFTSRRFGGNPLAVLPEAEGLTEAEMQAIAREFNLSETSFVLPPADPAHHARLRIFTPKRELPFAGHPTIGTAWVLAERASRETLLLEQPAGLVRIHLLRDAAGGLLRAELAAPAPLSLGSSFRAEEIAPLAGLSPADLRCDRHPPLIASVGNPFILAEVQPEALSRAAPDLAAGRALLAARPELAGRDALYLYAPVGEEIRARMFGPAFGVLEDAATGSAAAPLAGLLLHLSGREAGRWRIRQGEEMGRPSLLEAAAWREGAEIRTSVGGACVVVMEGLLSL